MSEVGSTAITKAQVVSASSSNAAKNTQPNNSGKTLPEAEIKAEKVEAKAADKVPEQELNSAVKSVKDYVQTLQRDIQFSVDKDLNKTIVKVVDSDSGDVIRQIPDDIFLELARRLKDDGEFRLLNALG